MSAQSEGRDLISGSLNSAARISGDPRGKGKHEMLYHCEYALKCIIFRGQPLLRSESIDPQYLTAELPA